MKILVVSDSHLEDEILSKIIEKHNDSDIFVHCGDSSLDASDPLLRNFHVVLGNHDSSYFPIEKNFTINGRKVLLVHGHKHNVYEGYNVLESHMHKNDIEICFHGHTHIPTYYKKDNIHIINPGSVMINRASYGFGTYAIVCISTSITVNYFHHTTHEECTDKVLKNGKDTMNKIRYLSVNKNR